MGMSMKWVTLLLLVLQTVASVMLIRIATVRYKAVPSGGKAVDGEALGSPVPFLNTTVVTLAEVFKFVASFLVLWAETGSMNPLKTLGRLRACLFARPVDILRIGVLSSLYTLQNNLVFVALANLSGAVYQVTYQMKILTTAVLSVLMLGKRLSINKWASLLLLTLGVSLIHLATLRSVSQAGENRGLKTAPLQQPSTSVSTRDMSFTRGSPPVGPPPVETMEGIMPRWGAAGIEAEEQEKTTRWRKEPEEEEGLTYSRSGDLSIGLAAVFAACFTSAFAGVYLEKILQESPISIWVRNIQLAAFGMLLGFTTVYWSDWDRVQADGFFQGYTTVVWAILLLQGIGGLIVAAVLKYADNILKCFGNAASILLSCLLSWWLLGDYYPTPLFCVGAALVIFATCAYTLDISKLLDYVIGGIFLPKNRGIYTAPTGSQEQHLYARVSTQCADNAETDKEMTKTETPTQQGSVRPLETSK